MKRTAVVLILTLLGALTGAATAPADPAGAEAEATAEEKPEAAEGTTAAAAFSGGYKLTVIKSGSGTGTVTSSPAGIECGATCAANFAQGTPVTLKGSPGPFTKAVVWSGCDEIVGADECRVGMTGAKSVGAAFAETSHFRFFSPTSFWNTAPPASAPPDPESAPLTAALQTEVEKELAAGNGPWINTTRYSVPIYTVPAEQRTVRVQLVGASSPALQAAFAQVPLPPGPPAAGTDHHLVVWQPSRNRLWEFWRLQRTSEGPKASWGGAIGSVSTNPGAYGPEAWPGAESGWGASASSLSIAGGLITLEDLRLGQINHALALALPQIRAGVYSLPAKRSDGKSTSPLALPEGAHLRLDPNLDLSTLQMPRITRLIAEAAQRYGIFIRDGASVVTFYAQDPVNFPENPYPGPSGYFEDDFPNQLLASFPWEHLQLLPMDLRPDR